MRLHWSVPVYVAGSIIGSALYFSVPANASPQPDPAAANYAYANGAAICDIISKHPTVSGVTTLVIAMNESSPLTPKQVGQALVLAVNDDCQQYLPLISRWADDVSGTGGANA
jgi:hypothetical protein